MPMQENEQVLAKYSRQLQQLQEEIETLKASRGAQPMALDESGGLAM